jgi:hypothetical protein
MAPERAKELAAREGVHQVEDWAGIHRLFHRQAASKTAIAGRLGMSRNTVERLLSLREPPRYTGARPARSWTRSRSGSENSSRPTRRLGRRLSANASGWRDTRGSITVLRDHLDGASDPDERKASNTYDDQSIYGWRLADVRRFLSLANDLPGLRRVDLEVNYRCPPTVVVRAVRLVEHNRERFAKTIRAGPAASGPVVLAADGSDETVRIGRVLDAWPVDTDSRAILSRTNRELLPAISAALDRRLPFRPPAIELLVMSTHVDALLDEAETTDSALPLLARIESVRSRLADRPPLPDDDPEATSPAEIASALVGWAVPYPDLATFRAAIAARRAAIDELCRDDAPLSLATAHGTKGLEFDHVAVIGLDAGRFPRRRSVTEAGDPERAVEDERRLAYVAWTRARRALRAHLFRVFS